MPRGKNALDKAQAFKLAIFLREHKAELDGLDADKIAEVSSSSVGFDVPPHWVRLVNSHAEIGIEIARRPRKQKPRQSTNNSKLRRMEERIELLLNAHVSLLERLGEDPTEIKEAISA